MLTIIFMLLLVAIAIGILLTGRITQTMGRANGGSKDVTTDFRWVSFIPVVLLLFVASCGSATFMPSGKVAAVRTFGAVNYDHTLPEGQLSFVWPWQEVVYADVQSVKVTFDKDTEISGASSDQIPVTMDLSVPVKVNALAVPYLIGKISKPSDQSWAEYTMAYLRSGARDALAKTPWRDALSANREKLEVLTGEKMQEALIQALKDGGIPDNVAKQAFMIGRPAIRKTDVPEVIKGRLADNNSASILQDTNRKLADAEAAFAQYRSQQGKGYGALIEQFPAGTKVDAAGVINALAFQQLVREHPDVAGKMTFIIGGAAPAINAGK